MDLALVYGWIDVFCFQVIWTPLVHQFLKVGFYSKACIVALSDPKEDIVIHSEIAMVIREKNYINLFGTMKMLY